MCGITGFVGAKADTLVLEQSLKNLEYRGYDSVGVALNGDSLEIFKQQGEIDDLTIPKNPEPSCAIGHTRWSTHGVPNDRNAHPHTDCTGRIAVVHNGIIDNFDRLREELTDSHTFESETDTEVIPHLIEDELTTQTSLLEAVSRVTNRLSGSYAIAVTQEDEQGIVAARQDSPLVIGHGTHGTFLASDVPAFIEHTNRVTYLEDGDIAYLSADTVEIYNEGQPVDRAIQELMWDAEAAEKDGYEHYMLKEIHEQPLALRQCISGRFDEYNGRVALDLDLPSAYLNSLEEIHIVASGTSFHAGLYGKKLIEDFAEVRVTPKIASEYEFNSGGDPRHTLVIAISQSGETADTIDAIRSASAVGAKTLAVTNTVGSTVTRETTHEIYIRAGPEIGVAATKSFTTQIATMGLLAVELGRRRNTLTGQEASEVLSNIRDLPGAVQQVLDGDSKVQQIATKYSDRRSFFFIGRNYGHPVALEGALKLKEVSYDHAEGFPAGELKHGPLALVDEDTLVIAILTDGASPGETIHNIKEVQARKATAIGAISENTHRAILGDAFQVTKLGRFEPVVANVYLQLFAYHVANAKGRPIDKPRNLAKSVTVR